MGDIIIVQTGQKHTGKGDQSGKEGIILASKGTNYLPVILLQCGKVWKDITNYKTPSPALWRINNQQMILMSFTVRFGKTPHPRPEHNTTINISSTPRSPTPAMNICEYDMCQVSERKKEGKHRTDSVVTSCLKNLCWPAGPHLHADLQQITGAVWSPLMLQMLHHHPRPKEPKITGLNDYRPVL